MQFPQTVEYALRAMACLALPGAGESLRATDLAARTGIPSHYLSKVMRRLVTAGLLHSQRGHGGGFVLARPAAEISFEEILRAVGYGGDDHACVFGWTTCDPKNPCLLHDAWSTLKASYGEWARTTRLTAIRPLGSSRLAPPVLPVATEAPARRGRPRAKKPAR